MAVQGTWFYVWMLQNSDGSLTPQGDASQLLQMLAPWKAGIAGLFLKVQRGPYVFNQLGGADAGLRAWIDTIQNGGYTVHGWGDIWADNPGPCGDRTEERREKLGLSKFLVDAEGGWSLPYGAPAKAKTYMDKQHNGIFDIGLTTYRYPDNFPDFPFAAFLNHEKMDWNSPQVYWIGSHNPVAQLDLCYEQYQQIPGGSKPFVPSASAFGANTPSGAYWEPTLDDLLAMREASLSRFGGVIWWSLDWVLRHEKWTWLDAICAIAAPPPPPPEPEPEPGFPFLGRVTAGALNLRQEPSAESRDIGTVKLGDELPIMAQQGDWYKVPRFYVHKNYIERVG